MLLIISYLSVTKFPKLDIYMHGNIDEHVQKLRNRHLNTTLDNYY